MAAFHNSPVALYQWHNTISALRSNYHQEDSVAETVNLFPQGHAIGVAFCNREKKARNWRAVF